MPSNVVRLEHSVTLYIFSLVLVNQYESKHEIFHVVWTPQTMLEFGEGH